MKYRNKDFCELCVLHAVEKATDKIICQSPFRKCINRVLTAKEEIERQKLDNQTPF